MFWDTFYFDINLIEKLTKTILFGLSNIIYYYLFKVAILLKSYGKIKIVPGISHTPMETKQREYNIS